MQQELLLRVGNIQKRVNNCEDCGKVVSFYAIKCGSCNQLGKKISEITKEKIKGENHFRWKGSNANYRALHSWIKMNKPVTERCEKCNEIKKLCLSNISGEYKRDINDFEWLCYLCHNKKDKKNKSMNKIFIEGRRRL
jgi:hypothetical protein